MLASYIQLYFSGYYQTHPSENRLTMAAGRLCSLLRNQQGGVGGTETAIGNEEDYWDCYKSICHTAAVLKLQPVSESPGGLIK